MTTLQQQQPPRIRTLDEVLSIGGYPSPDDLVDFVPGEDGCDVSYRECSTPARESQSQPPSRGHSPPQSSTASPGGSRFRRKGILGILSQTPAKRDPSTLSALRRIRYVPTHITVQGDKFTFSPTAVTSQPTDEQQLQPSGETASTASEASTQGSQRQYRPQQPQAMTPLAVLSTVLSSPASISQQQSRATVSARPWHTKEDATIRRRLMLTRGSMRAVSLTIAMEDLADELRRPVEDVRARATLLGVVPVISDGDIPH